MKTSNFILYLIAIAYLFYLIHLEHLKHEANTIGQDLKEKMKEQQ
jgi:hypothetical protein